MKVNYSDQKIEFNKKSIFLAGPTPRKKEVKSWRPKALEILEKLNFDGLVYVPEHKTEVKYDYLDQVEWERDGLKNAKIIVFWVERELVDMPAFTTNIEFGFFLAKTPEKVLYARPDDAPKNAYLDWLYGKERGKKPFNSLEDVLKEAVKLLK
ncbi:MAG: nucleoside 2-deoxyribosyltransferase domain-containing protein [Spirochaetales bacterium]